MVHVSQPGDSLNEGVPTLLFQNAVALYLFPKKELRTFVEILSVFVLHRKSEFWKINVILRTYRDGRTWHRNCFYRILFNKTISGVSINRDTSSTRGRAGGSPLTPLQNNFT